ncbi:MAG: chemotaxis protein CheW [Candidatus Delongbacteria bacterium]|nr:chemotaxis protein CheW [Candidatus Delongbacteria bacterium]MBN2835381.1 chemotaxis protein CheW [Candidatus Delongbacteria bacterium]
MSASILERKAWKLENIVNMMNNIVIQLHLVATEVGQYGRGIKVVANEATKFSFAIERDILGQLKFEDKAIEDVEQQMENIGSLLRLLGINAVLEAKRTNNAKAHILSDELRKIGESIQNILEPSTFRKNLSMNTPDHSFKEPIAHLVMNIAGTYWAENMNSIIEVIKINKEMLLDYPQGTGKMKHHINMRGLKVPVVNIHSEMGEDLNITDDTRVVLMNLGHIMYGHSSSDLFFGLLVDDVEFAGYLQKGVQELDLPADAPSKYVRYMWKTKDTNLLFFNWDNIINEHEIRDYRQIENRK